MLLTTQRRDVDECCCQSWRAAREALLLSPTGFALECVGRRAENTVLADYFMAINEIESETCPVEDIVSQVLQVFSEETQECTVADGLLTAKLAAGVLQRRKFVVSTDLAVAEALRDERQRISRSVRDRYVGAAPQITLGGLLWSDIGR